MYDTLCLLIFFFLILKNNIYQEIDVEVITAYDVIVQKSTFEN